MMNWVVAKIRWVLLVTGAASLAPLYAAVMPEEAVDLMFERTLATALDQIFVQGWAALAGIVGALMIYASFVPQARNLAMTVAGSGKLAFLGLMLAYGRQYLDQMVSVVLAVDALTVALFGAFAVGVLRARRGGRASQPLPSSRPETSARPPAASGQGPGPMPARPQAQVRPPVVMAAGKRLGPPNQ